MKAKRTSLNDIAKALNVSKATVSFVLNGKGDQFNISKNKQELVKAKAEELSYVPNFFAKSLSQGETKTIGLVLPDISNPFYAEICKIIQENLYASGYNTFIVNTNDDVEVEKVLMNELIQRSIDGMIISPSNTIEELIPILRSTHIPVVFTDRPGDHEADFVGVDNLIEAKKLIDSYSVKPKRISIFLSSPSDVSTIHDRVEGIKIACEEQSIEFEYVDLSEEQSSIDDLIKEQIDKGSDSFVTLNNSSTYSVLIAIKSLKIEIPKNVRLISFGDNPAFEHMEVPVSAIRQPIIDIANQTADRMYARLKEDKEPGEHFILPCEFMARGSH